MILTCPECATSYFVEDDRVPAEGRKVKCSSCGRRWLATPEGDAESLLEPAPPPSFEAEPETAAPDEDVEIVAVEPEPAPPTPARRGGRRGASAEGRSSAMVWAGAAALAAALIAGVIVFREQVVRLWPASSVAYAGLGLSVDGGGLVLEQVKVEAAFVDGRPVLAVTGAIRNVRDAAVDSPPVRVTLLNRAGKPVAAKVARPANPSVPAHALRRFSISITDPPATARDLEVRFVTGRDAKAAPRAAEAVLAPAEATPVPEPAEATPTHG